MVEIKMKRIILVFQVSIWFLSSCVKPMPQNLPSFPDSILQFCKSGDVGGFSGLLDEEISVTYVEFPIVYKFRDPKKEFPGTILHKAIFGPEGFPAIFPAHRRMKSLCKAFDQNPEKILIEHSDKWRQKVRGKTFNRGYLAARLDAYEYKIWFYCSIPGFENCKINGLEIGNLQ